MAKAARGVKSQAINEFLAINKEANPKEIVAALKEKGIKVSFGLASVVKYGTKPKKRTAKKAAKGNKISRSESIRQFMARHPDAKPKEIMQGLKGEGIRVTMGLISNVKYGGGKKAGKRRSKRGPVMHAAARKIVGGLTVDQLLEVKRFASSIGGADQLRQALDTLDQLK